MRLLACACAVLIASFSGAALAGVKVTEKVRSYAVSGNSGQALLDGMDRRGPKHGFLTRAIAQTSYTVSWKFEWGETAKACRMKRADGLLAITYTFPQASGALSPDLKRKWANFTTGVRKHENTHGQIARRMVRAAEKSVDGLTIAGDRGCIKTRREVKRRMAAVYAEYEARQVRFDAVEHREGGPVDKLIKALMR